ncbi:MAG: YlxM family DNA-binding protein [Clostridiales bacterium]|nr:YlxM family DNA-binding protein [Clostridiales bacterium]
MIEKRAHIAMLFDLYGVLLTEKQACALRLFYEEDLSLAEIAEEFTTSRQAVFDLLKRSESLLEFYESGLGLLRRRGQWRREWEKLAEQARLLQQNPGEEGWSLFWRQFEDLSSLMAESWEDD